MTHDESPLLGDDFESPARLYLQHRANMRDESYRQYYQDNENIDPLCQKFMGNVTTFKTMMALLSNLWERLTSKSYSPEFGGPLLPGCQAQRSLLSIFLLSVIAQLFLKS